MTVKRKVYRSKREKGADLLNGLVAFFVVNLSIIGCTWVQEVGRSRGLDLPTWLASWTPWVVNVGVVVLFLYLRTYVALGWLLGLGIVVALYLVGIAFLLVTCLSMGMVGYIVSRTDSMALTTVCMAAVMLAFAGVTIFGVAKLIGALVRQWREEE